MIIMRYKNELDAIEDGIHLWQWLVDNFPARKPKHPDFNEKYAHMKGSCPCCSYQTYNGGCITCCLPTCDGLNPYNDWGAWNTGTMPSARNDKHRLTIALRGAENILYSLKVKRNELISRM